MGKFDLSSLYLLAAPSTPTEVVEAVAGRSEKGETLTLAEAKTMIAEVEAKNVGAAGNRSRRTAGIGVIVGSVVWIVIPRQELRQSFSRPAMPDPADKLTPADPRDLADALAFALRFQGRKRVHSADESISEFVAKRLVEHLERAGFVSCADSKSMLHRPLAPG